jgi:hypothetical protein
MDGYKQLTLELIEVLLALVKIIKDVYLTTVKQILPDLAKSIEYLWEGLIGLGSWVGYAVAALYYFAAEAGQGKELCEASGIAF